MTKTLRDEIAIEAMKIIVKNFINPCENNITVLGEHSLAISTESYKIADAMIKQSREAKELSLHWILDNVRMSQRLRNVLRAICRHGEEARGPSPRVCVEQYKDVKTINDVTFEIFVATRNAGKKSWEEFVKIKEER